jgi:hypothetical protein
MGAPGAWMLAVTVLAAGACGDDEEGAWTARRASEVRELDFLRDVEVVTMTRAEYRALSAEAANDEDDARLETLTETYGRLGFFPLDTDLRPIYAGSSDWVGAFYSPRSQDITLVEDSNGDVAPSTEVHEYVHALQDQHFDLLDYDRAATTSDEFLARRAAVEGDATLAEFRFLAQDEHGGELDGWNWADLLSSWYQWSDELLAESAYPVFFLDYPSFVYAYGLQYTAANLLGESFQNPLPHDWSLEDELFTARPPVSAQQVIRRDDVDAVARIGLDAVPDELADRLESIDWDTLGEWYVYLLLYPVQGRSEARRLAAGWDGDRVLFLLDRARAGAVAAVWASSWDDDAIADQLVASLSALYGATPDLEQPAAGVAADGEPLWIERRGSQVVVIKNLDPALAPAVAQAAFDPPAAARARRSLPPLARLVGERPLRAAHRASRRVGASRRTAR